MKVWNLKVDKFLHKLKNPFARCRDPRDVGAFVKGIHY